MRYLRWLSVGRLTNPRGGRYLVRSGHSVTTDNHNTNHTAPQLPYSGGVCTLPPDITPLVLTNGQGQPSFEQTALATASAGQFMNGRLSGSRPT